MKTREVLREVFKLSAKEASIYEKLLQLGTASVQRISAETKLNKFSLYDMLEALAQKGVVAMVKKDNVKHYYAVDPATLHEMLRQQEERFREIMPELEKESEILGPRPNVRFFEGKNAIAKVNSEILREAREIKYYGSYDIAKKLSRWSADDFMKKRIAKSISSRGITDQSIQEHAFYEDPDYQRLTQFRIDKDMANLPAWVHIFNDKVAIISFRKEQPTAVIIEDEAIRKTHELVFEKLWKNAKDV